MAILCREHDLLYIRVPATGSSVVARALQEEVGGEPVPERPVRQNGDTVVSKTHCTVSELVTHGVLSRECVDRCLVVANVRNPFDRWTTYYQRRAGGDWIEYSAGVQRRQLARRREKLTDEEYERKRRAINQREQEQKRKGRLMRWLGFNAWMTYTLVRWWWKGKSRGQELSKYAFPMLGGVDVAIRQEHLNEGVNRVLEIAGVDERVRLPEKNMTSGKQPYTEYYAWSSRALVESMLGSEMRHFGYGFPGPAGDEPVVFLNNE